VAAHFFLCILLAWASLAFAFRRACLFARSLPCSCHTPRRSPAIDPTPQYAWTTADAATVFSLTDYLAAVPHAAPPSTASVGRDIYANQKGWHERDEEEGGGTATHPLSTGRPIGPILRNVGKRNGMHSMRQLGWEILW